MLKDISKKEFFKLISIFGLFQAIIFRLEERNWFNFNKLNISALKPKITQFPLHYRSNTSDIGVFHQIFVAREYSCLDDLTNVDLVIDCGANVGYSSAYFLSRFPQCNVICIEPDSSNFLMLQKNLAPYKERVKLIQSGVWSHITGLKFYEVPYKDGGNWGIQVRESREDEIPEMQAIDIGTLLKQSGRDKISILKVDIEGAEAVVFKENYESWLPYVENIVIELHDDTFFGKASNIVLNTISSCKSFDISTSGELSVFKKLKT